MDNFITYLLQSSLCLTVFLLFYLLLLKKETFYLGNRMYLIVTACFSVLVPLFKILLPSTGYTEEITYLMAPVFITNKSQVHSSVINWFQLSEILYFVVMSVLLLNFIFKLIQIFLLIKKNESLELKGQKIVVLEKGSTPFSFLNTIFLTKEQISDLSVDSIIEHEKKHIHQFHSMDMILFEIIKIMQWFNPFAWIFKKEIEAQHEFSADSGLLSDGININEYKSVLLAYSFGAGGGTITNNFNSLLKRRLEMLSKQKSHLLGKVKLFFTLPLMALLIVFISSVNGCNEKEKNSANPPVSTTVQKDEKGSTVSTPVQKDEKSSPVSKAIQKKKDGLSVSNSGLKNKIVSSVSTNGQKDDNSKIFTYADQMPVYPGGDKALYNFIGKNIVYPEVAKKAGVTGKIYVQFVIDKDGSVTDVKTQKGIGAGCDEEAVRVIKMMPKWIPGKNNGELVKTRISMPIVFALQ
jgi:TonB family protein